MKRNKILIVLAVVTVVLLFMPAIQHLTKWFHYRPMDGETVNTPKPELTFETYVSGDYQRNIEQYISETFGFRPPLIRLHNQYLWDFYRKTYSDEVAIGKDNWPYFNFNVNEYYGKEMYRWVSKEDAVERFTREMRILNKLKVVLNSYGIDFMVFTSPDKADLYPQHLPKREFDTTTIHAYDFYRQAFAECDFPYIDLNAWFKVVQDTLDFPAIPQASAHWVFPAVYAADSVFRFMAQQKGVVMPRIKIGKKIDNGEETIHVIRDLEYGLNLWRPIRLSDDEYYEREVTVEADSGAVKMNAVFVGNSFFRAFNQYIPLDEIFNSVHYWFYNMTDFYGPRLHQSMPIGEADRLYEIINADYIVWFTDNAQMYKISYGFAEDALIKLCVSDSLWNAEVNRYADSLGISNWDATLKLQSNPELIRGLEVDTPLIRNTAGIAKARERYLINTDPTYGSDSLRYEYEVQAMIKEIQSKPDLMEMIYQKAQDRNISVEEMLDLDARWIIDHRDDE